MRAGKLLFKTRTPTPILIANYSKIEEQQDSHSTAGQHIFSIFKKLITQLACRQLSRVGSAVLIHKGDWSRRVFRHSQIAHFRVSIKDEVSWFGNLPVNVGKEPSRTGLRAAFHLFGGHLMSTYLSLCFHLVAQDDCRSLDRRRCGAFNALVGTDYLNYHMRTSLSQQDAKILYWIASPLAPPQISACLPILPHLSIGKMPILF